MYDREKIVGGTFRTKNAITLRSADKDSWILYNIYIYIYLCARDKNQSMLQLTIIEWRWSSY